MEDNGASFEEFEAEMWGYHFLKACTPIILLKRVLFEQ